MKKKKISINIFMIIFLSISFIVLFTDYITYIFNLKYIYSLLISMVLYSIMFFILKEKITIKNDINKYDSIFFIVIAFFAIITIVFPDRTFDTLNYHLFLQENPFSDKIFGDFFPSKNINSFTYAFTDRLFYLFRFFLGYRLGTILQYGILIVIYYQIKNIFSHFIKNTKNNNLIISILSLLSTISLSIIELIDSYYVDNVSIIFLLELFIVCIFGKKIINKEDYDIKQLLYIGFLVGFAFVSKISNAILIIYLFIIYILKNRKIFKYLKLKDILSIISCFIFVIFIYVFYTWISTGNPVFPFYNSIFKSSYYSLSNWMDNRFGPKTFIEYLIWPVYMFFYPGRAYDAAIVEPMWGIGYIICFIYLLKKLYEIVVRKNKTYNEKTLFYFITFFGYLIWSNFMLGYTRYGLVVLVLGNISTYLFLYDNIKSKKYIMAIIVAVSLIFNYKYSYDKYVVDAQFWTFNNIFSHDIYSYKYNIKKSLKFNNSKTIKFEKNSVMAISQANSGFAELISDDIPMVSITNGVSNKKTQKIFNSYFRKNTKIYTLVDSVDLDNFIETINNKKYYITGIKGVYNFDFTDTDNFIYVFRIEKNNGSKNNRMEIVKTYDFKLKNNTDYNVKFYAGIGKYMKKVSFDSLTLKLVKKSKDSEIVLDSYELTNQNGNLHKYDVNINLNDNEKLLLKLYNGEEEVNEFIALQILNLEVYER